jgi:uncharacterized DUF497 family protein
MGLLFEWDPEKAASNEKKHNVTFDEASSVFADDLSVTTFDPLHSDEEHRFVIIGMSARSRPCGLLYGPRRSRADHQRTPSDETGAQTI